MPLSDCLAKKATKKTTITDIAKEIGVAQGLCYRYFPSKEVLFDSAIDQYADILVAQFAELAESSDIPLKEFIEKMPATVEDKNTKYYAVFHGPQNKKFHNQLSLKTSEKLVPIVEKLLLKARKRAKFSLKIYRQPRCFAFMDSLVFCWKTVRIRKKKQIGFGRF